MLTVEETMDLQSSAQDVWGVIGDFGALAGWHPAAVSCEVNTSGDAAIRTISIPGGGTLVEKLESLDNDLMTQSYSIMSGPLPVAGYLSTLTVRPVSQDKCTVIWSGRFEASGAPDAVAEKVVRGIYTAGLSALKERFD